MMKTVKIYPSLLAADFSKLAEEIRLVEKAGADGFHLDIMDGHFVPNISYGTPIIRSIRKITSLPFWAHLMIEEPDLYLEDFFKSGVQGIIFHIEIDKDPIEIAQNIHALGIQAGICLNPDTDAEEICNILDHFDRVLIMTVYPGFGGQVFLPGPLSKIPILLEKSSKRSQPLHIAIDGGVDLSNASQIISSGANGLVAGSSIFRARDPAKALQALRAEGEKGNT